ncbi:MAG: DUF5615 family PIN-like protein [bacterium]|nr:DUF5615 family PIN-like protein [bacterium]
MKFFLDANIPYSAIKLFKKPDIALHVRDVGLGDSSDEVILKHAFSQDAILITRDLDFANIILYPVSVHAGIIVIRVPSHFTAQNINDVLRRFLSSADKKLLQKATTILEPGRYRIRQ